MIDTIVLDIGNVLAQFRWKECLRDHLFEEELIAEIGAATVNNEIWYEWDRGIRTEADLIEECCQNAPRLEKKIREFFTYHEEWVREYDYSEVFVLKLKANGYKVYLLSNYNRINFQYASKYFKFYQQVDGGVISYEINHVKPEPEIYQALIDKYHINPLKAVFLDDTQKNLDGAKPFGFSTIQVSSFEQAVEDLKALGVKVK